MRSSVVRGISAASAIVAIGLLSGCDSASSGQPVNPAPANDAAGSPAEGHEGAETGDAEAGAEEHPPEPEAYGCDEIQAANGEKLVVHVDKTQGGDTDCGEATNVLRSYYQRAATESEGTARTLVVDGWNCSTDTTSGARSVTACTKDGRSIHTERG